ncbi:Cerato-platanin [Russula emetica]|nr:Cerato-platanin [Russula emetica]
MRLLSFIIPLTAILPAAYSVTVRYDTEYDNRDISLTAVACSDGENGLITKGYKTFGDLPNFPHIGAAFAVEGYNSASCGSCWELTYTKSDKATKTIYFTAIDRAADEFIIAETALKHLGGQQAVDAGHIEVTAERVAESNCVLKS